MLVKVSKSASNTILVVDDEPLNLELYTRRLSNDGYVVTTACDGQEAIDLLAIERYSVLLLDLNMPVMNGYDVLEWLQHQGLQGMRVIMLTAAGERDAVNACLTLGADDYVLKSAGMIELLHRVKRACQDADIEAQFGISTTEEKWQSAQILLVDDNAMTLDLMLRRFEHLDVQTYCASDGHVALQLLKQKKIDLVLLDYQMPDLNGLDVLEQIREHWHSDDIGVIMVTSEEEPDLVAQIYAAGADDYIAKPFHAMELVHRAHNVLVDKRLKQRQRRLTEFESMGKTIRSQEG